MDEVRRLYLLLLLLIEVDCGLISIIEGAGLTAIVIGRLKIALTVYIVQLCSLLILSMLQKQLDSIFLTN